MKKVKKIFTNSNGFSSIFSVIILLVSMLIFMCVFEYARLMIITNGVRDAIQSAVISAANDNYGNTYPSTRQGYSGGYKSNGSSWSTMVTRGDIYGRLDSLLGLTANGNTHIKANDFGVEYRIYGMSVGIQNAPFAPNSNSINQFTINTAFVLEVPVSFMGEALPPMVVNLVVRSRYVPKF